MCIIAVKPIGEELMERRILENCFNYNNDGAGLMYNLDGKVYIEKGYMNFKNFYNRLLELDKEIGLKDRGLVLHFRITTSGGTCMENCHPFPISNNGKDLKTLNFVTDIGVAHNGIISNYIPPKGSSYSDTQLFIKNYLYDIKKEHEDFLTNPSLLFAIEKTVGSKLAFLDGEGNITLVGKFIEEEDGCSYSNETYLDLTDLYKSWNTSYYCNSPSELDDEYDLTYLSGKQLSLDEFLDALDCLYTCSDGEPISLDDGRDIIARDGIYGIDCCSNVFEIDYVSYAIYRLGAVKYDEINFLKAFGEDDSTVEYPF